MKKLLLPPVVLALGAMFLAFLVSLPLGLDEQGLPFGLQIVGRPGSDRWACRRVGSVRPGSRAGRAPG